MAGLTIGADPVNLDSDQVKDLEFAATITSTIALTPLTHRRINVDASLGNVNLNLPAASSSTNVTFFIRRVITTTNEVKLVPDGTDNINGVNEDIKLVVLNEWIEVVSDGTEWAIINRDYAYLEFGKVVVTSLDDLPEPVAGVITLTNGIVYDWRTILVTSDQIDVNGAIVQGVSARVSGLVYTGISDALICNGESFNVNLLFVNCTSGGNVCNAVGAAGKNFNVQTLVSTQCSSLGTIDTFDNISFVRCLFENATTNGFTFTGTCNLFAMRNSVMGNNAGIALDFSAMTTLDTANVNFVNFTVNGGQIGVKNVLDSTNVTNFFRMVNSDFQGAGSYIDTFTKCDPPVLFSGNVGNTGTEDSTPKAEMRISDGDDAATSFPGLSTDVSLNGTFTFDTDVSCKFDLQGTNELRYTGAMSIVPIVNYKMFIDASGGSNDDYYAHVLYYEWNGVGYDPPVRIDASWDLVELDGSNPGKFVCTFEVPMHHLINYSLWFLLKMWQIILQQEPL